MNRIIIKALGWVAATIAGLFVLVLLAIYMLPQLVNLEAVKQGIIETVSSATGSQLTYSRVEILYLPRPTIILEQATLSARGNFKCSLSMLRAYPELVSLLKGKIRLAALQIDNPRFSFHPSSGVGKTGKRLIAVAPDTIRSVAASLLAIPAFQTPGFRIQVRNGRFSVPSGTGSPIDFQSINARVYRSAGKLRFKLEGTSNLGRKVTIGAQVIPESLTGIAAIRVRGFQPHLLLDGRQPRRFFPLIDSRMDMDLKLQFEATRRLRIELNGTEPFFRFERPGAETVLKSKAVKAVVNIREDTTVVSISDLRLDQPGLQVSGSLLVNRKDPEIRLDLSAGGIDVTALRRAALTLMGQHETVRKLFTTITGGRVPIITVHARGKSPEDLSRFENYIIRGNISGGDISIPEVSLEISNVRGEASIGDGLLHGSNISAQLGNSSGKNGRLTLGLVGRDAPFHLDIETLADAAQIQRVLMRLAGSPKLNNELEKVVYLSGTAEGRLVIGEKLNDLRVTASVDNAQVFAEYTRIPHPIVISGGQYLFHSTRFVIDKANARIGASELQNLSMAVDWSQNGYLTINGGPAQLDARELSEWLETVDSLQAKLQSLRFMDGNIALSGFGITGPLRKIRQWQYEFSGELAQLGFRPTPFSDALWVDTARFRAEPTGASEIRLQVAQGQLRWADSRMQLSGIARISASGADLDMDLAIGEITGRQVSELAGTQNEEATGESKRHFWPKWIEGVLRVTADRFQLGRLTFKPVKADVILHPGKMTVQIDRADMCGIAVPARLQISPWNLAFTAEPETAGMPLDTLFTCLFEEPGVVSGIYDMAGNVTAANLGDGFYRSLDGHLQFTSRSGRIYRHGILAKVLALLNMTEIFRGRLPDIVQKGFGYKTMKITGEFEDGKFVLRNGIIDGSSMTIVFDGHYDLLEQTMDVDLLVAPLKTIDAILQSLPVLNNIMKGGLISIPFRVEGKWDSIVVRPVPAEKADTGLLRTLNRNLDTESKPSQPLPMEPQVDPGLLGR